MIEEEFRVNEYIVLKLEGGKTNIYVQGKIFRQCKTIILNKITGDSIIEYHQKMKNAIENASIRSIDEIAADFDLEEIQSSGLQNLNYISPKEEFWAHTSNIQAWAEHYYDTHLLHSNLSFALLKRLTEVGDLNAIHAYKDEVARRLLEGNRVTIWYLNYGNYVDNLNREEFWSIFPEDFKYLQQIENLIGYSFEYHGDFTSREGKRYWVKSIQKTPRTKLLFTTANQGKTVNSIQILKIGELQNGSVWNQIFTLLGSIKGLKDLIIQDSIILEIPESIEMFKDLEYLELVRDEIKTLSEKIGNLSNLKHLDLQNNELEDLPLSLNNLTSLKWLWVRHNKLKKIKLDLKKLSSLKSLGLAHNKLGGVPEEDFQYLNYFDFDKGEKVIKKKEMKFVYKL